jgi:hypothetical protein
MCENRESLNQYITAPPIFSTKTFPKTSEPPSNTFRSLSGTYKYILSENNTTITLVGPYSEALSTSVGPNQCSRLCFVNH